MPTVYFRKHVTSENVYVYDSVYFASWGQRLCYFAFSWTQLVEVITGQVYTLWKETRG